jgi:hypothetical protein
MKESNSFFKLHLSGSDTILNEKGRVHPNVGLLLKEVG